jgi:Bap31/Bap29 transmembrane region
MVTFCILVAPLPYAVRKRLFTFLSESPAVAKLAYGLKISFMYVPQQSLLSEARLSCPSDLLVCCS